jgi:hypothetical protein
MSSSSHGTPVYLPVSSGSLKIDVIAFIVYTPLLKTAFMKAKSFIRHVLVRVRLLPSLNPWLYSTICSVA